MPECLFIYKSLAELRLCNCEISVSLPASISFPSLEKLHLCSVKYNNDETFEHLISGCSILEELVIKYLVAGDLVCCRIFSPTLKWLAIDYGDIRDHKVEMITPALVYLQVKGRSPNRITAQALSFLTEADLYLSTPNESDVVYPRSMLEFLDRMANVKCLKLETFYSKLLLSAFSASSPRFHSLTKLELAAVGWPFIMKFLEIADNLQVLIIKYWVGKDHEWVEPQQVGTCLQFHLSSIVIQCFCSQEHEYAMLRYLLKNGEVLASVKISCVRSDLLDRFAALQRISLFDRGSDTCKLDLC